MPLAALVLAATLQANCAPQDGLEFICGPVASEDLAHVPGTPWLLTSGLNTGAPAHLYLIDTRSRRVQPLFPVGTPRMRAEAPYAGACPGPPRLAALSTDGLNLRTGTNGLHTLFAANHGDRHAIEVFRIVARAGVPTATWVGCVPMPEGTLANAVVSLADGGLIVTSFHDPRDAEAWARMERGEPTGSLWEWHAGAGWKQLDVGPVAGANGLEISTDERTLYVSAWSARRVLVIARGARMRREILLDFLPDNIKRQPDGTLLVTGQRAKVADIAACRGPACPQEWLVARLDPGRGAVTTVLSGAGTAAISYACSALQVDDKLYVTARGDNRLIVVDAPGGAQ
jgi:hypothetical protein